MTKQTRNDSTPEDQPQNQPKMAEKPVLPNPKVQAPQNVLITEGYKPSPKAR